MFNFLKQKLDAKQFGVHLAQHVGEFLFPDADRALAAFFPHYDLSNGPSAFFESNGITKNYVTWNRYLHMHSAIQGASVVFDKNIRMNIAVGAMSLLKQHPGYNPHDFTLLLEGAYIGDPDSSTPYDHANNYDAILQFLPDEFKDVAVKGTRLIITILISNAIAPRQVNQEMFNGHSLAMASSTATVYRAISSMQSRFRIKEA